jgi:hypothetical protein
MSTAERPQNARWYTLEEIAALPPRLAELVFGMAVHVHELAPDGRVRATVEPSRTVALMSMERRWPPPMTAEEIAASRIQRSIFVVDDAFSPEPRRARTALGYGLIAGLKGMGT